MLFIDCDTLVMQDLTPLWEMDMGDKWLYGVDDCRGAAYRTNLGLQPTDNYINNGVLLVDLDAWRKNNVEDMFLRYIRENQGDITFVDQGVQNGVLSKLGRSGILHPKYNCMTVFSRLITRTSSSCASRLCRATPRSTGKRWRIRRLSTSSRAFA